MAMSVNKVILLGHIGKDPEITTLANGNICANYSLATTQRYKDKTGAQVDKTEWHHLVSFKRGAEVVRDYVKKGSKLYVEGSLQTRSWEDKESGKRMTKTSIVVSTISLLDGREKDFDSKSSNAAARQAREEEFTHSMEITEDDIPF